MLAAVDHEVERFQPAIASGVPEIDHRNIVVVNIPDQIGFGKLITGLVEVLYQRTRVHFGKTVGKRVFHTSVLAESAAKVATLTCP
jgi:hypothetical protein